MNSSHSKLLKVPQNGEYICCTLTEAATQHAEAGTIKQRVCFYPSFFSHHPVYNIKKTLFPIAVNKKPGRNEGKCQRFKYHTAVCLLKVTFQGAGDSTGN